MMLIPLVHAPEKVPANLGEALVNCGSQRDICESREIFFRAEQQLNYCWTATYRKFDAIQREMG